MEKLIWKGTPSQWVNFKAYFLSFLLSPLVIPLFYSLWKYLTIRTWKYHITSERIILNRGIFSKLTDELELFRVKDIRLLQPFWMRLVNLSTIVLVTSDRTISNWEVIAISNGQQLKEQLRIAVDKRRIEKKVRETDFE